MSLRYLQPFVLYLTVSSIAGVTPMSPLTAADNETRHKELLKSFHDEFVEITPGKGAFPASFMMGTELGPYTEQPAHLVTFNYSFSIARYEVPQNLYEAVMGNNPSKWKGVRNSVEMFTIEEAHTFCRKMTNLLLDVKLLDADEEIRLPTEAEWEYCCRAGTKTPYSFGESAVKPGDAGNKASALDTYGWHTGNAAGNDPPVGAKAPNPWGLYDMHGYLWEFVSDGWHETYSGAPRDGSSWSNDKDKVRPVVRGGSWKERYECHRSAFRRPIEQNTADDAIGFRCVKARVRK